MRSTPAARVRKPYSLAAVASVAQLFSVRQPLLCAVLMQQPMPSAPAMPASCLSTPLLPAALPTFLCCVITAKKCGVRAYGSSAPRLEQCSMEKCGEQGLKAMEQAAPVLQG
jgi:hypothetical protein